MGPAVERCRDARVRPDHLDIVPGIYTGNKDLVTCPAGTEYAEGVSERDLAYRGKAGACACLYLVFGVEIGKRSEISQSARLPISGIWGGNRQAL